MPTHVKLINQNDICLKQIFGAKQGSYITSKYSENASYIIDSYWGTIDGLSNK